MLFGRTYDQEDGRLQDVVVTHDEEYTIWLAERESAWLAGRGEDGQQE
jgi:hypothetical protein